MIGKFCLKGTKMFRKVAKKETLEILVGVSNTQSQFKIFYQSYVFWKKCIAVSYTCQTTFTQVDMSSF